LAVPTSKRLNVAVVGATGMVGGEMLRVLAQRNFPSDRIVALASERSKGLTVAYNGSSLNVEEIKESAFQGIDVALFAASGDIALMYGPAAAGFLRWAAEHGAVGRDGLGMLVEQAAEAFQVWRGIRPPSPQVLAELRAELERQ